METKRGAILTVGLTPDPVVYSLERIKPDFVALVHTKESARVIDDVLSRYTISPSQVRTRQVEDSPQQIGKLVRAFYEAFLWLRDECQVDPQHIYTDPTPGRKWMSAGVTMIASFLNLNLFYTDVKFKDGKPDPSTMQLVELGNALKQTGFVEAEKARDYFNRYDFASASEIFLNLSPILSETADLYNGLGHLARLLHRWELFEHYHASLQEEFGRALDLLSRYLYTAQTTDELQAFVEEMKVLADTIETIYKSQKPCLLATVDLIMNAKRRIQQGRYDDAVARCYRAFESLSQYYLRNLFQIDTSEPDYEKLETELKERLVRHFGGQLPIKISLDEGWQMLWVLDARAAKSVFHYDPKKNKLENRYQGILSRRNTSILAHGWEPISEQDANKMVEKLISLLITAEGQDFVDDAIGRLKVPSLPPLWRNR